MKLIADTNLLVRLAANDDSAQAKIAKSAFIEAEIVAIPLVAICEFAWVMRSVYKFKAAKLAIAIRLLLDSRNSVFDQTATEAGLAILESGGDFADGVIAHEGKWLGGEVFASFDKDAIALLKAQGHKTQQL